MRVIEDTSTELPPVHINDYVDDETWLLAGIARRLDQQAELLDQQTQILSKILDKDTEVHEVLSSLLGELIDRMAALIGGTE